MFEGMKQIAPGLYVDDEETLHIDAAELCVAAGYEPTEENQERLVDAARAAFDGEVSVEEGATSGTPD